MTTVEPDARGARLSDSDILVFMTQDAVPADRNLIGNLIRPLQENSKVGAAYARQLAQEDCAYLEKNTPEDLIIRNFFYKMGKKILAYME